MVIGVEFSNPTFIDSHSKTLLQVLCFSFSIIWYINRISCFTESFTGQNYQVCWQPHLLQTTVPLKERIIPFMTRKQKQFFFFFSLFLSATQFCNSSFPLLLYLYILLFVSLFFHTLYNSLSLPLWVKLCFLFTL